MEPYSAFRTVEHYALYSQEPELRPDSDQVLSPGRRVTAFEDQFLCSICLELFNKPVTAPCGHTFCQACITTNWDVNIRYECPLCKQRFSSRPILKTNTLVAEMVSKIKTMNKGRAGPGDVACHVCSEPKLKALKSCLTCVASYCERHLKPHRTVQGLKAHELINPVQNLQDRVCSKHNQPLKHFCQTDKSYLCVTCSILEHRQHRIVSLEEVYEKKKSSLLLTQTKSQNLIKQRKQQIQEIERQVELSQKVSEREVAGGEKAFTALMESVQSSLNQFLEEVHEKQKQTRKQAEDLVKKLELEISELEKRNTEVQKLLDSEDHFNVVQNSTSLPRIEVCCMSFEAETCQGRATQLLSELKELLNAQINKNVLLRAKQFAVDVSLDPNTAYAKLTVSEDLKMVHHTDVRKKCPDSAQRFSDCHGVLGTQTLDVSFYFEVQVKGKTEWDLGVALENVNRQGSVHLHPLNGYWSISLRGARQYYACTGPRLFLKSAPLKVGVFVDYEGGKVEFYDVHTADLIHSFTGCDFVQKLLPFFSPGHNYGGKNSSPLVLMAVKNLGNPTKKRKQ